LVESIKPPNIGPRIIVSEPIEDRIQLTPPASLLSVCVIISVVYRALIKDPSGEIASHKREKRGKSRINPIAKNTRIPIM